MSGETVAKRDSLLAHCLARAVVAEYGGEKAAAEALGANAERLTKWTALKVGVKVTPKAARVAGFIVLWATAMKEEDRNSFTITEYQRRWNEGERQAYRLQSEFRELWPEFETPNELAGQIVRYFRARVDGDALPLTVPVLA